MTSGPGAAGSGASWRDAAGSASQIGDLVGRAAAVDAVAAVSGHVLAALAVGSAVAVTIPDRGSTAGAPLGAAGPGSGRLDGAAVALAGDPAEVVVDPAARGRGMGTGLVRVALDRQGAVWAYGDLPAAAAIARRIGLRRGRVLLQMRLELPADEAGPVAATPTGVRFRTFVPGQDEQAFLAANARAFAWHPEQGRLDLAGLRADMAQDWFDPAGFFLAVGERAVNAQAAGGRAVTESADTESADTESAVTESAGGERVLGFHWTKVHPAAATPTPIPTPTPTPSRPEPIGEVYVLGVDPEAGVRGLGAPLTAIGLDHLRRRGLRTVILYVEGDNDRAVRLYQRFGFSTHLTNVVYSRPAVGTS